jgi:hypothetical protein
MHSSFRTSLLLAAAVTLFSVPAVFAQDAAVTSSPVSVVPHVVKYSGALPDAPAAASVVEVRFAMYTAQTGGQALWTETQQVALDPQSKYSVLLGATLSAGLPQNLFANGQPRWLGVTLAGQEESPRTLLAATPYSLKASDAETLGGHPASDFALVKAKPDSGVDITSVLAGTGITVTGQGTSTVTVGINSTYLDSLGAQFAALAAANTFKTSQTIEGNLLVSGAFTTPNGTSKLARGGAVDITYANGVYTIGLDATQGEAFGNGLWAQLAAANSFTNTQTLGSLGTATTSGGFNSNALKFSASAYSTTLSAAEAVNFVWQAEPYNNNSASPSGYIDLLTSTGTAAPTESGLRIGLAGRLTFASGQTFPGAGTITGITTTSPLAGSGTTGSVALSLNTTALETTLNGVYPRLAAANTFAGANTFSEAITFASGQTFPGVPTLAGNNTFAGSNTFSQIAYFDAAAEGLQATGPGYAAILGFGSSGSVGTFGSSDTGYGIQGESTSGQGVIGNASSPVAGSKGVLGYTGTTFSADYSSEYGIAYAGVWADTSSTGASGVPLALFATAGNAYGAAIVNDSASFPAVLIQNSGGIGAEINAAAPGDALDVNAEAAGNGIYSIAQAPKQQQAGVEGVAVQSSSIGSGYDIYGAIWGDTGVDSTSISPTWAIGVLGTADNSHAGVFLNNSSSWTTLYVKNYGTGGVGTATTGLFDTIMAVSKAGTCGVGSGSLSCTGQIKSLVSTEGGARTVETYAMQSPENWMEDFGSGSLVNGKAEIRIDPGFAETVSGDASYHVFLTPNGDSKGLYVVAKSASGFEVRESGGGTSSLSFDYRIVGKRRGYESERLADVTDTFTREIATQTMARSTGVKKPASARKISPLAEALKTPHRRIVPSPAPRKTLPPHAVAVSAHPVANR